MHLTMQRCTIYSATVSQLCGCLTITAIAFTTGTASVCGLCPRQIAETEVTRCQVPSGKSTLYKGQNFLGFVVNVI
jgi:hypothetical protein